MEESASEEGEIGDVIDYAPAVFDMTNDGGHAASNGERPRKKARTTEGGEEAAALRRHSSGDHLRPPLPQSSGGGSSAAAVAGAPLKRRVSSSRVQSASEHASSSERRRRPEPPPGAYPTYAHPNFGIPIHVRDCKGSFPAVGSTLGPFFCLEVLGKGTFSSVHKCVNLEYFRQTDNVQNRRRLAAAKVELSSFVQSGVLEGEATVLEYLHKSLPPHTVPVYMGHYKSTEYAAILMEYLPGEDMNMLRESIRMGATTRRVHVKDAVYLTAEVMLPLLERMHDVGVVHRDVKPSNCVRSIVDPHPPHKQFCLVDFGLSKSIVVPKDSPFADAEHPWQGKAWLKPGRYEGEAHYRKERPKADFRGSSMYASLRVHQLRDYSPRDDVWSVLYVFCDLVSGGLPWMSHAANKERDKCGQLKEMVHGEYKENLGKDEIEQLLMGDEYHVAKFRWEQKQIHMQQQQQLNPDQPHAPLPSKPLPDPLAMSGDQNKVGLLRKAFQHLQTLQFWDRPDYALVQECIRGFLHDESTHPDVPLIDWNAAPPKAYTAINSVSPRSKDPSIPSWDPADDVGQSVLRIDPIAPNVFDDAEKQRAAEQDPHEKPEIARDRLPIRMQFYVEQMSIHAEKPDAVDLHVALRDWFEVALPLLYKEWDSGAYEDGRNRKSSDNFRRMEYLKLLRKCQDWAKVFNFFRSPVWRKPLSNGKEEGVVNSSSDTTSNGQSGMGGAEGHPQMNQEHSTNGMKREDKPSSSQNGATDGMAEQHEKKAPVGSVDEASKQGECQKGEQVPAKSEETAKNGTRGPPTDPRLRLRKELGTDASKQKPSAPTTSTNASQNVKRQGKKSDLVLLSKALVGLKLAAKQERDRPTAPPERISFSS